MQVHGRGGGMELTLSQLPSIFLSRHRLQAVVDLKSHNNNHTQDIDFDLAFDLFLYKHEL